MAVPRVILIAVVNTMSHDMSYRTPPPAEQASTRSETATTATTLPPRGVGRGGGHVLDTSNAHTGTGKSAESRLGTGAGGLGAVSTSSADLDVEGRDAELLAAGSYKSSVLRPYFSEFPQMYAPTSWAANMAA